MNRLTSAALVATLAVATSAGAAPIPQPKSTGNAVPNASCQLVYQKQKGPLIQNVKVFTVFYSKGNAYRDKLVSFYMSIVQSPYIDWLLEYNINNYKIGRGTFLGYYEDNNSTTSSISLQDSDIGTYLDGLITGNKIPAPDDNTMYTIYFPSNVTITLQGEESCSYFCAYHSSYTHGNSQLARYSVIPDVTTAPCAGGCGANTDQFSNLTSVSSHELIEAITDPDANTAWVDTSQNCGEIGDICNAQQGCSDGSALPTSGGKATACASPANTIQLEWSNSLGKCIAVNPAVKVTDFTATLAPMTLEVPVGGMATAKLTLAEASGSSADTAKLTAATTTDLVVSFSPTSATTNAGTSTVTVAASPTAMVGETKTVMITAAGTSASHTVSLMVTVTAPPDMAQSPDLAEPSGNGGGGSGGNGTGGNGGNGSGGNGNRGGGSDSGCSMSGADIAGSWVFAGLLLLALAFRRRRV